MHAPWKHQAKVIKCSKRRSQCRSSVMPARIYMSKVRLESCPEGSLHACASSRSQSLLFTVIVPQMIVTMSNGIGELVSLPLGLQLCVVIVCHVLLGGVVSILIGELEAPFQLFGITIGPDFQKYVVRHVARDIGAVDIPRFCLCELRELRMCLLSCCVRVFVWLGTPTALTSCATWLGL
jgi:hypothetical protein